MLVTNLLERDCLLHEGQRQMIPHSIDVRRKQEHGGVPVAHVNQITDLHVSIYLNKHPVRQQRKKKAHEDFFPKHMTRHSTRKRERVLLAAFHVGVPTPPLATPLREFRLGPVEKPRTTGKHKLHFSKAGHSLISNNTYIKAQLRQHRMRR